MPGYKWGIWPVRGGNGHGARRPLRMIPILTRRHSRWWACHGLRRLAIASGWRFIWGRNFVCRPRLSGNGRLAAGVKVNFIRGAMLRRRLCRTMLSVAHCYWTTGPEPVGHGAANGYGLHNMCDNVHEWCSDWYSANYYAISSERNPRGPEAGERRASRGGSWRHHVKMSRCAARSSIPPGFQYADYGFRVACEVEL